MIFGRVKTRAEISSVMKVVLVVFMQQIIFSFSTMDGRKHNEVKLQNSNENETIIDPLKVHHASLKKLNSVEEIDNYSLWYSAFEQKAAVSDFEFLKEAGKTPILVVKQRWDNGMRLPYICPVKEIGKICVRTKEHWKRHFFEVSNQFCFNFILIIQLIHVIK